MHPLTHHEIVGLIEPFVRRGLHADLAASDRIARSLAFRPVDHAASDGMPAHRETLRLDDAATGPLASRLSSSSSSRPSSAPEPSPRSVPRPAHRLTRTLALACGAEATLCVEGTDLAGLLACIEAVPRARQLRGGPECTIALAHRLDPNGDLRLTHATARVEGLDLTLTMPTDRGNRADIVLAAALDDPVDLPEDLLAVLGWDWSRLDAWTERTRRRWTGSVRVRGRSVARSIEAEAKFERAAGQIARTLAEPPARFHERLRVARWIFAFRRTIPLIVCVALIAAAFAYSHSKLGQDSVLRMLVFNLPPLLLVAFFCLRELPRFELPRRPRRLRAVAWRAVSIDRSD